MPRTALYLPILRDAIAAQERYDEALAWREHHIKHGGQQPKVTLTWDAGSALEGYAHVRAIVEKAVEADLASHIDQAVGRLKAEANTAIWKASEHLKGAVGE